MQNPYGHRQSSTWVAVKAEQTTVQQSNRKQLHNIFPKAEISSEQHGRAVGTANTWMCSLPSGTS